MLRYLISLCLIFFSLGVGAQIVSDTTGSETPQAPRPRRDTIQIDHKYLPTGIVLGADILNGAKSFLKDDVDWFNFMATVDFWRYEFSVDYGRESRSMKNEISAYETEGSYFKFGPNVNFMFTDPDLSSLFIGLRYATNTFSDKLIYSSTDPVWGDQEDILENNSLNAKWFELVGGLRVKLFRAVWMGYTSRFKFGVDSFSDANLIPNYLPGYGRADLQSTWEFNYWLIIRIPISQPDPKRFDFK